MSAAPAPALTTSKIEAQVTHTSNLDRFVRGRDHPINVRLAIPQAAQHYLSNVEEVLDRVDVLFSRNFIAANYSSSTYGGSSSTARADDVAKSAMCCAAIGGHNGKYNFRYTAT